MKVAILIAGVLLVGTIAAAQQSTEPVEALDGVDTVILLKEGKEVFGKQAFRSEHDRFAYLFSSAETKAEFDKAPEKYAIQMGGLCARMGGTTTGNPSDYFVHENKIYVFGSDACHKAFAAAPSKYLPKAAPPMPRDMASSARGQILLDKAVASMGGAKLDTLTTYVEATAETQPRPSGDVRIVTQSSWRFPGGARAERTMTMPNRPAVSYGTLLTPEGAWTFGGSRMMPVIPQALASVQQDLGRQLVPLLRSRRSEGTRVAALGSATIDGTSVERVRVRRDGLDVTLNIDPVNGRVHSSTFVGRNREGEFGEYTLLYADYRDVSGVTVPFVEKALFNGSADASRSRTLDSVTVNAAVDATLFQRPR